MHTYDLKALARATLAVAAAAALVSCGGSSGSGDGGGPGGGPFVPPPPLPVQSQFGIGFSMIFGTAAMGEPRDPQASDVIPISLSADPIDIPDPM